MCEEDTFEQKYYPVKCEHYCLGECCLPNTDNSCKVVDKKDCKWYRPVVKCYAILDENTGYYFSRKHKCFEPFNLQTTLFETVNKAKYYLTQQSGMSNVIECTNCKDCSPTVVGVVLEGVPNYELQDLECYKKFYKN